MTGTRTATSSTRRWMACCSVLRGSSAIAGKPPFKRLWYPNRCGQSAAEKGCPCLVCGAAASPPAPRYIGRAWTFMHRRRRWSLSGGPWPIPKVDSFFILLKVCCADRLHSTA